MRPASRRLVKIPGGTHGFNFETPDLFNRAVLDFLARTELSEPLES